MYPEGLTYEWTVRSSEETVHPLDLTDHNVLASSSRFMPSIVLHEGVLVPGIEYVFQLAAWDNIGTGAVQTTVQVNAPPRGGWVEVAPNAGLAYTDIFELAAPGWVDEELPLWFQYSCQAGGKTLILNEFSPLPPPGSALSSAMPLEGPEALAYQVTVHVTVRDSLGATSGAERNITVTSPTGSDGDTEALMRGLVEGVGDSLLSGDSVHAMVLVDSVAHLLGVSPEDSMPQEGGEPSGASNVSASAAAMRRELLAQVAQVKEGAFPTTSVVERFAMSVSTLSSDVRELSDDAQAQSLGLLKGLVQDTQSVGVQLSQGAAQSLCSGLASLNGVRNATRAGNVAEIMAAMARSMLDGKAAGEGASEVARSIGSEPESVLYTEPLKTAGAAVAFPSILADELVESTESERGACNSTNAMGNSTECDEEAERRHGEAGGIDVDTRLMVMSEADPHREMLHFDALVTSGVTTIAMTLPDSGADVAVQGLSEAITFSLQLNGAQGPPGGEVEGAMRCAFWNETLGAYSTAGCTQLPNPAPAGASLLWRTEQVAELPAGLSSAWVLAPGELTQSCVESFGAVWAEYGGADLGLRKYLSNSSACELALPGNEFGCWWNWTHQDVLDSAILLTIVWGIMGGALYLAMCSACENNEIRRALLNKLTKRTGTGKHSFRLTPYGAWLWTMFAEDRDGQAGTVSLKRKRSIRKARQDGEISEMRLHVEQKLRDDPKMLSSSLLWDKMQGMNRFKLASKIVRLSLMGMKQAEDEKLIKGPWVKPHEHSRSPFPLHRLQNEAWCIDTEVYSDRSVQPFSSPVMEVAHAPNAAGTAAWQTACSLREMHSQLSNVDDASRGIAHSIPYWSSQRPAGTRGGATHVAENFLGNNEANSGKAPSEYPTSEQRRSPRLLQHRPDDDEEEEASRGSRVSDASSGPLLESPPRNSVDSDAYIPTRAPPPNVVTVLMDMQQSEYDSPRILFTPPETFKAEEKHDADDADDMFRLRHLVRSTQLRQKMISPNLDDSAAPSKSRRRTEQSDYRPRVRDGAARLENGDLRSKAHPSASTAPDVQPHTTSWLSSASLLETDVSRQPLTPAAEPLTPAAGHSGLGTPEEPQADHHPGHDADCPTSSGDLGPAVAHGPSSLQPNPSVMESIAAHVTLDNAALGVPNAEPRRPGSVHTVGPDEPGEAREQNEHEGPTCLAVASDETALMGGAEAKRLPTKQVEKWIHSQLRTAVLLSKQLHLYLGQATSRKLLEGFMTSLRGHQSSEAVKPLDPEDPAPVKAWDPTLRRRLCVRLRAVCVMIRILHETQDLSQSNHLCKLLNLSMTSMRLRIPMEEMRQMVKDNVELGAMASNETFSNALDERKSGFLQDAARKSHKKMVLIRKNRKHKLRRASNFRETHTSAQEEPLESMIGTAVVIAYLETTRVVKAHQLELQVKSLNKTEWEFKGQTFMWYLTAFRVMMSTIHSKTGWFYRCIIWNLLFLQQRNGSFRISSTLATVLAAGDTTDITTRNPTDESAYSLWATMCVIERCLTLPFTWIINPEAPIEDRCSVTSIAKEFVDTEFINVRMLAPTVAEQPSLASPA
eukprot:gene3392-4270_t